jgi:hypothetical protein
MLLSLLFFSCLYAFTPSLSLFKDREEEEEEEEEEG